MQSLQSTPLENNCIKNTPSKLKSGLDFSGLSSVKNVQNSGRSSHSQVCFFFLPKGRLGEGGKKREEGRERESEKLFTTLAIHCPSTQFQLAQAT